LLIQPVSVYSDHKNWSKGGSDYTGFMDY